MNLLLIEDNPGDARLIREMIREDGVHLTMQCADRLASGLETLDAGGIDAVLLDLSLPDSAGLDTLYRVHGQKPSVPVVVLTGSDNEELADEAVRKGAQDYLVKGTIDGKVLLRSVRYAIERKRAQEHLRVSEERFFRIFSASPVPTAMGTFGEGRLVEVNQRFAEFCGYTREELVGRTVEELQLWADPERRMSMINMLVRDGSVRNEEAAFRSKAGEIRDALLSMEKIDLPNESVPMLVAMLTDITERKRTERSLQELAAIVESSEDGMIGCSIEGIITSWNKGAQRIYGYSAAEAIGCHVGMLSADRPQEVADILAKVRAGEAVHQLETVRIRKDGKPIHISLSVSPVKDASGRITGTSAIAVDRTEQKRLEQQLRQAQKMEAVGRLAGGIAHDFNNLLGVIIGYGELLQESIGADSPMYKKADEIRKAGHKAAALTRQLLAFSRQQVLQPAILDLNTVVADMERMLQRVIGEDVELTTLLGHKLGRVKADQGQLEQVVMNLAVNARDAMPHGGKLTIETATVELDQAYVDEHPGSKPGRHVMLAVRDTGIGMDAETQSHIFEPFFTTKGLGKGTGLGLATVYGIIKQSEGYIGVISAPGQGTTFEVYLPAVDAPLTPQVTSSREPATAKVSGTILLVEDADSLRDLTRQLLEESGYTVLPARSGPEAIHVAGKHKGTIDLLLTDVVMPGMDGCELAAHVTQSHKETRVLYMSGYSNEVIAHRGALDPGVALVQKPFTRAALTQKIAEVLGRSTQVT